MSQKTKCPICKTILTTHCLLYTHRCPKAALDERKKIPTVEEEARQEESPEPPPEPPTYGHAYGLAFYYELSPRLSHPPPLEYEQVNRSAGSLQDAPRLRPRGNRASGPPGLAH